MKAPEENTLEDAELELATQCLIRGGLLFTKQGKRIVREWEVDWIFTLVHRDPTSAHPDKETTIRMAQRKFTWPTLRRDLTSLTEAC